MTPKHLLYIHISIIRATMIGSWLFLATACQQDNTIATATPPLRIAMNSPIGSLDPLAAFSSESKMLVAAIYDTLYTYKPATQPYELVPGLATSMPEVSSDGTLYTIRLRTDFQFQSDPELNSTDIPVDANDVVYSLLRHLDPANNSTLAAYWKNLLVGGRQWSTNVDYDQPPAGLKTINAGTLQLQLQHPEPELMHWLAHPANSIVSRQAVEHYGDSYGLHPTGSGPYALKAFNIGRITLQRRAQVDDKVENAVNINHVNQIQAIYLAEPEQRWQQLLDQEVDLVQLQPTQYSTLLETADQPQLKTRFVDMLNWSRQPSASVFGLDFNLAHPAVSNSLPSPDADNSSADSADTTAQALRCQIANSIDWHAFNEEFFDGLGYVLSSPLSPLVFTPLDNPSRTTSTGIMTLPTDLLPVLTYGNIDSPRNRDFFSLFKDQIVSGGYPTELINARWFNDFGRYLEALNGQELALILNAWQLDIPTALNILQLYSSHNVTPKGPNLSSYQNADFDDLYTNLVNAPDLSKQGIINQMILNLSTHCVTASGYSPPDVFVWRNHFQLDADYAFGYQWLRNALRQTL